MTNLFLSKKKVILSLLFSGIFLIQLSAQKNAEIWSSLLKNDRQKALKLTNKLKKDDIESAFLKRIVLMENGNMEHSSEFISNISNHNDFTPYLFANWNLPFVFGDYIENGFNKKTYEAPQKINSSKISNSTVKNGLTYLQAISFRHQRKWEDFKKHINKINAIKDWEYCGVFENLNASGIDMPYEPEEETSNKVKFNARSKGSAYWYTPTKNTEVYNFFSNHSEFGAGVHYAQTFINSEKKQRVLLRLGKGELTKLWLNNVLIHENDSKYITELDAFTYEVNLQKGVNRILIKSASSGATPYFIVRLEDLNEQPLKNYTVSFKNRSFVKSSHKEINPKLIPHKIETYFLNKLKQADSDVHLSTFCLAFTYYRNGKLDEAIEIINAWAKEYPESSFIKSMLAEFYAKKGDETTVEKIQSNIKRLDPDYYLSLMLDFEDTPKLMKLDISTYEAKLKKIASAVNYSFLKPATDFMIYARRSDQAAMKTTLNELLQDENLPSNFKNSFSEFHSTIFNDDKKTIEVLEKFNNNEFNSGILSYLAYYYNKQNRKEDVIKLYDDVIAKFENDNDFLYRIIEFLHENQWYEKSLPYIEKGLKNFPNSYLFAKLKGDAFVQLNKKKEAIKLYEIALSRRPTAHNLRTKIQDLSNKKSILYDFTFKNPYQYIEKNRNKGIKNNYGLINLWNETSILNYNEGGGEYITTYIYEITSQNGIDIFKEYNLGLSGNYIINKSEIIKPTGEVVPADRSGSKLVFEGLSIGDIIYIDYEEKYSRYGRFYKDYIHTHTFTSYHPSIENTLRFITLDKAVKHHVSNGKVDYNTYKKGKYYIHEWKVKNNAGIPIQEDFMPNFDDVVTKLHISSIKSWNEIANWYSDIVRKQLKVDDVLNKTFSEIFPNGIQNLSEDEKAKRIYYYITDNLNYSHVSFRQGGYIPQKPSKTISSRLGDCKDFSALYTMLAQKAGLKTNMVLILTSDYGKSNLILPSTDFNHCIVKVTINNEDYFLELTDKNLPYKSLPISLRGATALIIPMESNTKQTSDLFHLENTKRTLTTFRSTSEIDLAKNSSAIKVTTTANGHLASYYIDVLTNKKGKLLDDTVHQELENRVGQSTSFVEVNAINHDKNKGEISYTTLLTSDIKINKISNLYTFSVPYFLNPYNNSIIQGEERFHPIEYKNYENTDIYNEKVLIKLKENQEFVDYPKDANFSYKNHKYSVTYVLKTPNELQIEINATTKADNISAEDYKAFKKYVTDILDTRETLIAFKNKG